MISTDINLAAKLLLEGDVVGIPTETVYGLAANIYIPKAIEKIFTVKRRPKNDPLIVHIYDVAQLDDIALEIPEKAKLLMEKFWPGPLTFLLPKTRKVADDITAESPFVAVRMPNHPLTLELLRKVNVPLAAPSANLFQRTSPTTPQHVEEQLGTEILVLDGGECGIGVESTIIGFERQDINVFRLGGVPVEEIQAVTGSNVIIKTSSCNLPGSAKLHYSTNKPLIIGDIGKLLNAHRGGHVGVLSFQKKYDVEFQVLLSEKGDLLEAAKNLYKGMRILDAMPVDKIFVEYVPDEGLGKAINDRLTRAAAKRGDLETVLTGFSIIGTAS